MLSKMALKKKKRLRYGLLNPKVAHLWLWILDTRSNAITDRLSTATYVAMMIDLQQRIAINDNLANRSTYLLATGLPLQAYDGWPTSKDSSQGQA